MSIQITDHNGDPVDVAAVTSVEGEIQGLILMDEDGNPLATFGITGNVTVDSHVKENRALYPSAARTASPTQAWLTSPHQAGVIIIFKVSAGTSYDIAPRFDIRDAAGTSHTIDTMTAFTGSGAANFRYYIGPETPGGTFTDQLAFRLPLEWSILPVPNNANSITYSTEVIDL